MSPFGSRLTAASDMFRQLVIKLDIDGELGMEDLDCLERCLITLQDSITTYRAQMEEAFSVACDRGAANGKC